MILNDIIKAATDATSLSTLLRMCTVLAHKVGNERLKSWATQELNGYSLQKDVPESRVVPAGAVGTFVVGWSQVTRNIPSVMLDTKHREWAEVVRICEPVRTLEHVLQTKEKGQMVYSWNANLVVRYQGSIMENCHMIDAHQEVPKGAIAGVLDTIRNRVLEMALELQGQIAITDDDLAKVAADQKKAEKVDKTVVNIIYGGGNVYVADSGSNIQVNTLYEQKITAGDWQQLMQVLAGTGIDQPSVAELEGALKHDNGTIGSRVQSWIKQAAPKMVKEGAKIGVAVGQELLTQWLKQYCGLSQG